MQISSKNDAYLVVHCKGNGEIPLKPLGPAHTSRPHLDPRQLLDPKGYNADHRKDEMGCPVDEDSTSVGSSNQNVTNALPKRRRDASEASGMANMIERIHNVTERQDQPRKKRKTDNGDDNEEKAKACFRGGGRGGEIGDYMKQKREEGQKESGPSDMVVDLTQGDTTLICGR